MKTVMNEWFEICRAKLRNWKENCRAEKEVSLFSFLYTWRLFPLGRTYEVEAYRRCLFVVSTFLNLYSLAFLSFLGDHAAPDPELERKLKEMEANQMNAWEEKEKLSQALEAERQANMNNVISEMMNTVKEQKVCSRCCYCCCMHLLSVVWDGV